MKGLKIVTFALLIVALSGCFAAETAPRYLENDPVEIVGKYVLGKESFGGYVIAMLPRSESDDQVYNVITSDVEALGWNDAYILAESYSKSSETFGWTVIIVATGQIYQCSERWITLREHFESEGIESDECVYYEEFVELKENLGVPDTLEMQEVQEVYERLNE